MSEELPRYPRYSLIELLEAFTGLDAHAYPDRAALILEELTERFPETWGIIGKRMREVVRDRQVKRSAK